MKRFKLYSTSACHLCEQAQQMIEAVAPQPLELEEVAVSETDELFERYGLLIPVLQHPDGREMNWPFAVDALRAFLES